MSGYTKGEMTHQALIETAKELFYRDGYDATRCNDIAKAAGANPGLIHYYFKTKSNIAREIYADILVQMMTAIAELCADEKPITRTAMENRILWRALELDESFRRFVCEIAYARVPMDLSADIGRDYMRTISEAIHSSKSDEMLSLLCQCSVAFESELIQQYGKQTYSFSAAEMGELDVRFLLELVSLPYDEIDNSLLRSAELMKTVDVKMDSRFDVSVERRG